MRVPHQQGRTLHCVQKCGAALTLHVQEPVLNRPWVVGEIRLDRDLLREADESKLIAGGALIEELADRLGAKVNALAHAAALIQNKDGRYGNVGFAHRHDSLLRAALEHVEGTRRQPAKRPSVSIDHRNVNKSKIGRYSEHGRPIDLLISETYPDRWGVLRPELRTQE